jgi:GT2 family glycosyltransferase
LVYRGTSAADFVAKVQSALAEPLRLGYEDLCERRMDFVRHQTWEQRAQALSEAAEDAGDEPTVSVVVISYNQWHLTERCLQSLESASDSTGVDVIVVDNASKDETPQKLELWRQRNPKRFSVILNTENRGFGGAVNQGLAAATGEFLVILNNDTVVSPGWARGLRRHFEKDPTLGVICPITNNIGNEAQVALRGSTVEEVFASARNYSLAKTGELLPLGNVAFFCVMLPRAVYQRIGGLDERFFPGFFEDDDYCLRVKQEGWTIGCAEDVFVYHELSASFGREEPAHRKAIFDRNKRLFEEKWGTWKPHVYRAESLPPK